MDDKSFKLVRNMTNFLKRYKPENYEVFASENDELLVTIYLENEEPEVWVGLDSYAIVFDDYNGFEQLTLDELLEKLEERKCVKKE